MENASKALIIAGAILISIVLVAIAVMVVGNLNTSVDETVAQMDQTAKDMFNAQFENFEGRQSGSNARQLISRVISNNTTNSDVEAKQVTVSFNGQNAKTSSELSSIRTALNAGVYYTVSITYGDAGLITTISIAPATSGTTTTD